MEPWQYPWPLRPPDWEQLPPHQRHDQQDWGQPPHHGQEQQDWGQASQSWSAAVAALQCLHQAMMYDAAVRQAQIPVPNAYAPRPQPRATEDEAMEAAERALAMLELEEQQRSAGPQAPPGLYGSESAPSRGGTAGGGEDDAARQHEVGRLLRRMEAEAVTTVMLRNLPRQLTQERLLQALTEAGFAGTFDFLYMPTNVATGEGNGYGFINFSSWPGLQAFVREWHGRFVFFELDHDAPLSVSVATLQGREVNVNKWSTSRLKRVRNPMLKPIVLPDAHYDAAEQLGRQHRTFVQGERERRQPASGASGAAPR